VTDTEFNDSSLIGALNVEIGITTDGFSSLVYTDFFMITTSIPILLVEIFFVCLFFHVHVPHYSHTYSKTVYIKLLQSYCFAVSLSCFLTQILLSEPQGFL